MKNLKKIKYVLIIILILLVVWFFVINPIITFSGNEKKIESAAKRYYELNSSELPTGERVKTLNLQKLYDKGMLREDFFIPLSKKTCSNENSWVKVRRENNEFKYYVYLDCKFIKSKVDHEGPEIVLKGKESMTINVGDKYKDPGVKSVTDGVDGSLKVKDVTTKGKVDTSKIGTYSVEYTAFDNLKNKTTITREVRVVRKVYNEISKKLGNKTNFVGYPEDNYIMLSNMLFNVYGTDNDKNIIVVANEDIANVNYTKIDEWLKYFYSNLNKKTKKMIVDKKYCSMTLDEKNMDKTECDHYTDKKKVYIPSVVEINNSKDPDGASFMKPGTLSWIAEKKDNKQAYVTRNYAYLEEDEGVDYFLYDALENYGVRPMMTIKGDALLSSGDGSAENPYSFTDKKKAKGGDLLNTREVGEYVVENDNLWRIVKIMKDGTTKVISMRIESGNEGTSTCYPTNKDYKYLYNPNDKKSVGYCINNKGAKYFETTNFENHEITVPIYKDKIIYGEEVEKKKYKAVLSAPDMYEMFSAVPQYRKSYWLINSSKQKHITGALTEIGVPINGENQSMLRLSIRPVAYYKKNIVIASGKGTETDPYVIG